MSYDARNEHFSTFQLRHLQKELKSLFSINLQNKSCPLNVKQKVKWVKESTLFKCELHSSGVHVVDT